MASNKNNNILGFKLFSMVLIAVMLSGWIAITLYIAEQTESRIRTSLLESPPLSSDTFYLELISYKRSLFTAQMETRLRSKNLNVNDAINNLIFRVDIKHGPLIFNDTNVQLAMASLQMYLDKSQLSSDAEALLARIFGEKNPFSVDILVGYDSHRHYRLHSSAFEYEVADMKISVSKGLAEGVYESDVNAIPINIEFDEIVFKQGKETVESNSNHFIFSLLGKNEVERKLNSKVMVTKNVDYLGSSINLNNLQTTQLFDLVNRYEDRYNLDQQIEWTLEVATQYQEGQDKLLELFQKQDAEVLPAADKLVGQLLKQGTADISYLRKVNHQDTSIAYNSPY